MCLNVESRGYVEFICLGGLIGLSSGTQDEAWDFFEKLTWDTYEFEQVKKNFGYPTHGESAFHANPYHQDHYRNLYHPYHSFVPPVLCDYCESSYHDTCTCPCWNYIDATCASVEKKINDMTDRMIETMKERIAE